MNVELKRRTTSLSMPAPTPANDNSERMPKNDHGGVLSSTNPQDPR